MIIQRLIGFLLILMGATSCTLDGFMFNGDTTIETYQLDEFEGETEIVVGDSYHIDDQNIWQFSLPPTSDRAEDLYCVFVGDSTSIASKPIIVYCHGNAGHMDYYWPRVKLLANTGSPMKYNILMMDYRGFGLTGGTASEEKLVNDVDDVLAWLNSRNVAGQQVTLYGFSLGSYPSTYLMKESSTIQPGHLILENPFSSTSAMSSDASGLSFPSKFVMSGTYDNEELIKKVHQPFLWFHGLADDYLHIESHGEVVWANYTGKKGKAYRVENATHNDLPEAMGYTEYLKAIDSFIDPK